MDKKGFKRPRRESIEYFISRIQTHRTVLEIEHEQGHEHVFKIKKKNGKKLIVYLTDFYIVTEAEVYEIMSEYYEINAIVTISNWNSYSYLGRETARENDIGLFLMSEFMGALNFDGNSFINYISPAEREAIRKREKKQNPFSF
ncbi:hypothetical protein ACQKNS_24535 [Peribacillus sp. NPDC094092]|uniref:hypothetical protein n=1 Tax=Peribacillus sp. NPDC094092 TaxID=3390611 RepID=UPI003CFC91E1